MEQNIVNPGTEVTPEVPMMATGQLSTEPVEEPTEIPQGTGNESIDPETEENILYKKYGLEELDAYMDSIGELSYLELISLRNNMNANIERIESCNSVMRQLRSTTSQLNAAAAMANCLDHYGIDLTADEFDEMYALYVPKLKQIINLCNIHIKGIGDRANSTKYMNGNMILVLEKRLFALDREDPKNETTIKELVTAIDIYKNRTNFAWISNRLAGMVQNKKQLRLMAKTLESGTASDVFGELAKMFTPINLGSCVKYMQETLEYEEGDILAFLYCMNRILDVKATNGLDNWVKVFILNISDIMGGIYDLRRTADELRVDIDSMLSYLLPQATQYLYGTRKIKVNGHILDFFHKLVAKYDQAIAEAEERARKLAEQEAEEETMNAENIQTGRGMTKPVMFVANNGEEPDGEEMENPEEADEKTASEGEESGQESEELGEGHSEEPVG